MGLSLSEGLVEVLVLSLSRVLDLILLLSAAGVDVVMEEEEETDLVVTLLLGAAAGMLEFFSGVTLVMRSLLLFITCCSFCCHFLLADCRARRRSCSSDSSSSSFSATGGCSISNRRSVKSVRLWMTGHQRAHRSHLIGGDGRVLAGGRRVALTTTGLGHFLFFVGPLGAERTPLLLYRFFVVRNVHFCPIFTFIFFIN